MRFRRCAQTWFGAGKVLFAFVEIFSCTVFLSDIGLTVRLRMFSVVFSVAYPALIQSVLCILRCWFRARILR